MYDRGTNHEIATSVYFIMCLPLVALASEIFYRLVDIPSAVITREIWAWMKK